MKPPLLTGFAFLLASLACSVPETRSTKVIIGASAIDSTGEVTAPSIIIVRGTAIDRIGPQADIPVPAASEKTPAYGKFVIPAPPAPGAQPGCLRPGCPADLWIVSQDPRLAPPSNPERVLAAGEWTR